MLVPISRLTRSEQDQVFGIASVSSYAPGELVYRQGEEDEAAHYLLTGIVDVLWHGKVVKSLDAKQPTISHALDTPGYKGYTVRARTTCTILRVPRSEVERKLRLADLSPDPVGAGYGDVEVDRSSNWMIRMLQLELFANIPVDNIQEVLERMEEVEVESDEIIVRQGDPGDYYFVIEDGYCEVVRQPKTGGDVVHLATLGPGDGFGEEALVADAPRSASVVMRSDGRLMRLERASFNELIRQPLLDDVTYDEARLLVAEGAVWFDVRYREQYAAGSFLLAVNIPLMVLRAQCRRLHKGRKYIVCSDDLSHSRIGAFLLAERGFDVGYLVESMTDIFDRDPSAMQPPWRERYPSDSSTVVPFPRAASTPGEPPSPSPPPPPPTYAPTPTEPATQADLPAPPTETPPPGTPDPREAQTIIADDSMRSVPRPSYATTILGETLADLIDEMRDQYRELSEDDSGGSTEIDQVPPKRQADAVAGSVEEVGAPPQYDLEAVLDIDTLDSETTTEGLAPRIPSSPAEVEAAFSGGTEGDELSRIVRTMEANVRQHVKSAGDIQRRRLEEELASRTAKIKQVAIHEIRRRTEEIRRAYQARYEQKEKILRRNYEKLIRLANKIARQKAEIRKAKHELEEKLKTATQLHHEVDAIRNVLNQHIGNLDGLDQARDSSRRA